MIFNLMDSLKMSQKKKFRNSSIMAREYFENNGDSGIQTVDLQHRSLGTLATYLAPRTLCGRDSTVPLLTTHWSLSLIHI